MGSHSWVVDLAPGVVIANRFRLLRQLGAGGMGSVWLAQHITLGVEVAVKFILPAEGRERELLGRFEREAKAAAKIRSQHVVGVLDYGADETGRPYLAMEYLRGEDVGARLARAGPFSVDDTVSVVAQACKGLGKAHAAGITHRDLKPENLFLCDDEDGLLVKVLDFGIAKATSSGMGMSGVHTSAGTLLGTPYYMSPEQALGQDVDFRSDLYSLGVVAFHMLTGSVPYDADSFGQLVVAITSAPLPNVAWYRQGVSPEIGAWLTRATQKNPRDRWGSAKEMGEALVSCHHRPSANPWDDRSVVLSAVGPETSVPDTEEDDPSDFTEVLGSEEAAAIMATRTRGRTEPPPASDEDATTVYDEGEAERVRQAIRHESTGKSAVVAPRAPTPAAGTSTLASRERDSVKSASRVPAAAPVRAVHAVAPRPAPPAPPKPGVRLAFFSTRRGQVALLGLVAVGTTGVVVTLALLLR